VTISSICAEPLTVTSALWARAAELDNVTIVAGMMVSGYPFLRIPESPFRLRTWFMPGTLLGGEFRNISAEYLPLSWAQTVRYLGQLRSDVAMIQVSPADLKGFHSLGISSSFTRPIMRNARLVIAEVNDQMPRTRGHSLVHESELDVIVPANYPLPSFPHREGDDIDLRIGRLAAEFVPNGATLQFGVGTIPNATVRALLEIGRHDLRVVSQLTDPAMDLIRAGAAVDENPKAIVGDIYGSQNLYRWVDGNGAVSMVEDGLETHGLNSFRSGNPFVSINSGLEVDLLGQLNSETINGKQTGAIGGSIDFAIGAQFDGGTSVIAIRTTTKQGASRIVTQLAPGAVTVPRSLIQFIVTEYGIADLRNRTVRERATALTEIAHPDHRDALRAAARLLE